MGSTFPFITLGGRKGRVRVHRGQGEGVGVGAREEGRWGGG